MTWKQGYSSWKCKFDVLVSLGCVNVEEGAVIDTKQPFSVGKQQPINNQKPRIVTA